MRVSTHPCSELNWGRMILGAVVGKICVARSLVEAELTLGFAEAEPPESHVHRLDVFGDDGLVDDTGGGGVVGLDGRLGLQPTHFDKGLAHGDHSIGADEETCEFSFGS